LLPSPSDGGRIFMRPVATRARLELFYLYSARAALFEGKPSKDLLNKPKLRNLIEPATASPSFKKVSTFPRPFEPTDGRSVRRARGAKNAE
jgi:hypothetical protein